MELKTFCMFEFLFGFVVNESFNEGSTLTEWFTEKAR